MDEFISYVYAKNISTLSGILRGGYDINSVDPDGRTALMHAVLDSDPDLSVIKFLLDRGCCINARDSLQKWSVLHFSVRDNKKSVVALLLQYNPLIDIVDVFGNTPLWRAVMSYDGDNFIISSLINSGADPRVKNGKGVSPLILAETLGRSEVFR